MTQKGPLSDLLVVDLTRALARASGGDDAGLTSARG
jgi:hypothetical protein